MALVENEAPRELTAVEVEAVGGGMRLDNFDPRIKVGDATNYYLHRSTGPLSGGYVTAG